MRVDTPAAHPCDRCSETNAPFGFGPPATDVLIWLCLACWQREPSTQKLFAERMAALITDEDKATWANHPGPNCRCPNCTEGVSLCPSPS